MKVEQYLAKNQFRLYDRLQNILQSYDSKVIEITNNPGCIQCIILGRDWDYSRTTSKYVYQFLDDYSNMRIYGIANKRKYVNDLIEEYKQDYKKFIDKYNYILIYDEEMA